MLSLVRSDRRVPGEADDPGAPNPAGDADEQRPSLRQARAQWSPSRVPDPLLGSLMVSAGMALAVAPPGSSNRPIETRGSAPCRKEGRRGPPRASANTGRGAQHDHQTRTTRIVFVTWKNCSWEGPAYKNRPVHDPRTEKRTPRQQLHGRCSKLSRSAEIARGPGVYNEPAAVLITLIGFAERPNSPCAS